jgi:NitT/TauT family transport system substrate-binding protein
MLTRRPLWICILILLSGPGFAQTKPLVVGQTSRSASDWPNYIAQDQGFYKQAGVSPQTIYIGNVAEVGQQVAAGSLDIGLTTFEVTVRVVEAGAPIVMVGSTLIKYPYSLMSDKNVGSAADLVGKKVILPVPKSDVANAFDQWMNDNHIAPSKVDEIFDGSSSNRFAALNAGVVAAAVLNSPLDFTAESEGYPKLLDFGKYLKSYGFVGIVVRRDWLKNNAETLRRYLAANARAINWLYDSKNREEAVDILMRATKQSRMITEKTYDYYVNSLQAYSKGLNVPNADLTNVVLMLARNGTISPDAREAPPSKYADLSYLPK